MSQSPLRPRTEITAFAALPVGRGISLSGQQTYTMLQDASIRLRTELLTSARIGRRLASRPTSPAWTREAGRGSRAASA